MCLKPRVIRNYTKESAEFKSEQIEYIKLREHSLHLVILTRYLLTYLRRVFTRRLMG